jgi:hypothetical protein
MRHEGTKQSEEVELDIHSTAMSLTDKKVLRSEFHKLEGITNQSVLLSPWETLKVLKWKT